MSADERASLTCVTTVRRHRNFSGSGRFLCWSDSAHIHLYSLPVYLPPVKEFEIKFHEM